MKVRSIGFLLLAMACLGACAGTGPANRAIVSALGPVRTVTDEPGVVPPGTRLVVRTEDNISTHRALRGTIYSANVAEDVLDQNGTVLLPRESPVELVVRSLPYLGAGGVGTTELMLEVRAVTINGVRYPAATETQRPRSGGLGIESSAAEWVGGSAAMGEVITRGDRISVPTGTLLALEIEDPIRLRGFRR
jgi:hypothetical protein